MDNSIDGFAPGQLFFRHLVFFEDPGLCAATPDQELQLPESETYLIRILGVCKNALEKESDQSGNSIYGFALAQLFSIWLLFGARFSLVFANYRLVEAAG